jgi:hypothetical protein
MGQSLVKNKMFLSRKWQRVTREISTSDNWYVLSTCVYNDNLPTVFFLSPNSLQGKVGEKFENLSKMKDCHNRNKQILLQNEGEHGNKLIMFIGR